MPFGNGRASGFASDVEFGAALRRFKRPIDDLAFSTADHEAWASGIHIGGLIVTAISSMPLRAKSLVDPQASFSLPVSGSGKIILGPRIVEWGTTKPIVTNSFDKPLELVNETLSMMTLRPTSEGLQSALRSVLDDRGMKESFADEIFARLMVRGPVMDLGRSWSVDYYAALLNIAALIDNCNGEEAHLTRIGLEDVVNRLLAQLVLDQEAGIAAEEESHHVPRSVRAVDLICDHIRSRIGKPLSMSEMEDLSGLSGRALNYAFRARFDCSPQEWQRNFLLDHARQLLRDTGYTGSVKAMAYELGFSTASSFAAFYRERFGERPSETLSRRPRTSDPGRTE